MIRAEEWKYSFAISQTAMEDKLDFVITSNGQNLMDAYHRTRNNFMWGLLGAALIIGSALVSEGRRQKR